MHKLLVIRSNNYELDSRLQRTVAVLRKLHFDLLVLDWNRTGVNFESYDGVRRKTFGKLAPLNAGVRNVYSHFLFQLNLLRNFRHFQPDIIYACDLDTACTVYIWSLFSKTRYIFDEYDPFDERLPFGITTFFFRILGRMVKRRAMLILYPTELRVESRYLDKSVIFENFPIFSQDLSNGALANDKLPHNFFIYAGALNKDRGLETLLDCVNFSPLPIVFAGQGNLAPQISEASETNAKIIFLGSLPYQELLKVESRAIAIFAFYDPNKIENRSTASNKLGEALILKLPIITNYEIDLGAIVEKYNLGWVLPYGNRSHLQSFFQSEKWVDFDFESNLGSFTLLAKWENQLQKFVSVLTDLEV